MNHLVSCCRTTNFLLPYYFKWIGGLLLLGGVVLIYLRFVLGINPDIFECKVFAIYSVYFKTRSFAVISNVITEELCAVLTLVGLSFMALAKQKDEKRQYQKLRCRAMAQSLFASTFFVLFSILFFYGTAFMAAAVLSLFVPVLLYNVLFYYALFKYRKQKQGLKR